MSLAFPVDGFSAYAVSGWSLSKGCCGHDKCERKDGKDPDGTFHGNLRVVHVMGAMRHKTA